MKKVLFITLLVFGVNASANNHHLPKGCTQIKEIAGECNSKPVKQSSGFKQLSSEAEHVMNMSISDAAEYLLSKGWKPNNRVWKKSGYTLTLVVEKEKVVNAQLSK
jgi:hypothetical protein